MSCKIRTALTIAGSDSGGGAGIQADIKTMTANGVYAMSVITALTAQNTMGVSGIYEVSADFLKLQMDAVFEDIFPDAVKIGMVSNAEIISAIAEKLEFYNAKKIVLDPVMISTSGSKLISSHAVEILTKRLMPLAKIVTPNIPEAEVLAGVKILSASDMENAAAIIGKKCGCAVLVKGGHSINDASDVICYRDEIRWFKSQKINNPNTHGTGCTLSSAIAANLAKGKDIYTAVEYAKRYVSDAISAQLDLGKGSGPLNHMYRL